MRSLAIFSCLSLSILIQFNKLSGARIGKNVMLPNAEISICKQNAWDKIRSLDIVIAFVNTILIKSGYLKKEIMLPTIALTSAVS